MADEDYDVGYGKPPKAGQFKPGQSGNPNGKPKGAKNLKTELEEELHETIPIKEQGKTKKVSKQRAMLKSLMAKAVQGDTKAANVVLGMTFKLLGSDNFADDPMVLTATDHEVLEDFKTSILAEAAKINKGPEK
jgi:hypothetical protein